MLTPRRADLRRSNIYIPAAPPIFAELDFFIAFPHCQARMILPHNPEFDADPRRTITPVHQISTEWACGRVWCHSLPNPIHLLVFLYFIRSPQTRKAGKKRIFVGWRFISVITILISLNALTRICPEVSSPAGPLRSSAIPENTTSHGKRRTEPDNRARSCSVCVRRKGQNRRAQASSTSRGAPYHPKLQRHVHQQPRGIGGSISRSSF